MNEPGHQSGDERDVETRRWVPVRTDDGSWTLRHTGLGEACHSRSGAWREAVERYAVPCRLRERALEIGSADTDGAERTFRLLDIGTGVGLNIAAAVFALECTGASLEVMSFENDPDVIRAGLELAAEHPDSLPSAGPRAAHRVVNGALARALACAALEQSAVSVSLGAAGRLRLVLGDARLRLPAIDPSLRFDAVFLDPFSPGRAPALWASEFLADVARRMAPGAILSTYSAAFAVRLELARTGLRVGLGPPVGEKAEGTVASPDASLPPLPARVTRRLESALNGPGGPDG